MRVPFRFSAGDRSASTECSQWVRMGNVMLALGESWLFPHTVSNLDVLEFKKTKVTTQRVAKPGYMTGEPLYSNPNVLKDKMIRRLHTWKEMK